MTTAKEASIEVIDESRAELDRLSVMITDLFCLVGDKLRRLGVIDNQQILSADRVNAFYVTGSKAIHVQADPRYSNGDQIWLYARAVDYERVVEARKRNSDSDFYIEDSFYDDRLFIAPQHMPFDADELVRSFL